jgi:hypothetical protein
VACSVDAGDIKLVLEDGSYVMRLE